MAAIANFTFNASVSAAQSASGSDLGLKISEPQAVISASVIGRRAQSTFLVNVSDSTGAFNFIGITFPPQIVLVVASSPVQILLTVNGLGTEQFIGQIFAAIIGASANSISALQCSALTAGTTVDISVAG